MIGNFDLPALCDRRNCMQGVGLYAWARAALALLIGWFAALIGWLTLLIGLLAGSAAQGQTTNWTNTGVGGWDTASNWSAGVPTSSGVANIGNSGTAQVTGVETLLGLSIDQTTLTAAPSTVQVFRLLPQIPAGITISQLLIVGGFGNVTGPGTLAISGGASVEAGLTDIGANATGTVTVQGTTSVFKTDGELEVANGSLTAFGGATVTSTTAEIIGSSPQTGLGTVSITGSGTTFTTSSDFQIGDDIGLAGTVTVAAGGSLAVSGILGTYPGSTVNIGAGGASGTVTAASLTANGTLNFNTTDTLSFAVAITGSGNVQNSAAGTVTLTNLSSFTGTFTGNAGEMVLQGVVAAAQVVANSGAVVQLKNAAVSASDVMLQANANGTIDYINTTLSDGFLRGPGTHVIVASGTTTMNNVTTFNSTMLMQNGTANFNNFTNGGMLTTGALLNWNAGSNSSSGVMTINSAVNVQDFTNNGVMTIGSGGSLNNSTSSLVFGGSSRTTVNSGGVIDLTDTNTLELNGALLVNAGKVMGTLDVNFGSTAQGSGNYGTVNVTQGGKFAPANGQPGVAVLTGNYTQLDGATLQMSIKGTTPGMGYDQLQVAGNMNLSGELVVSLGGGFQPAANEAFQILNWAETLAGTFEEVQLPTLTGSLEWNTSQLYTEGELSVIDPNVFLPGDFNRDGHVNAADIMAMEKALVDLSGYQTAAGLNHTQLLAIGDINGDGVINNADLQALIDLLLAGGGSATPVPEPGTLGLMVLCGVVGGFMLRVGRRCYS